MRSDLTEPEHYDAHVGSNASNLTRSRSSVMIQLEADGEDYCDNIQSTSLEAGCQNRFLPYASPMSELLSPSLQKSFDCHNEQTKSKRIGPEEFLEMLRKKKNTDLLATGGRRRTVSSSHCIYELKLLNSM